MRYLPLHLLHDLICEEVRQVDKVLQWNLSIADTIGESQFVRYREVSLVERFDIFQHLMTIIIINVGCLADASLSYGKDTTVSIREPTLVS